jgi:hypothetical protein
LNYFTPTFHEWKDVTITMDLVVGEYDAKQGFTFANQQSNTTVGGGVSWAGSFSGSFSVQHASVSQSVQTNAQQVSEWSSGQLLVDAQLGPRRTGKFPVPASVVIAPQIYITQGQVTDVKNGNTVTSRSVVLTIELRKASGEISVNRTITLEAGGLLGGGSYSTDPKGQATMTLTRNLTAGSSFQKFPLSVSLGQIRQPFTVTL